MGPKNGIVGPKHKKIILGPGINFFLRYLNDL